MLQPKKATDDDYDDNNGDSGSGSRNTWAAIGIPGNWEAGSTSAQPHEYLGIYLNTWGSTPWGSTLGVYSLGVYSLRFPIWDLGNLLPVLKKQYRGPYNITVV